MPSKEALLDIDIGFKENFSCKEKFPKETLPCICFFNRRMPIKETHATIFFLETVPMGRAYK